MTTFPDAPEAAYFTMNEPEKDQALIQERVKQGFLIRTRADADTREARRRRDQRAAKPRLASGAQFISTDYSGPTSASARATPPRCRTAPSTRCNPVECSAGCDRKAE